MSAACPAPLTYSYGLALVPCTKSRPVIIEHTYPNKPTHILSHLGFLLLSINSLQRVDFQLLTYAPESLPRVLWVFFFMNNTRSTRLLKERARRQLGRGTTEKLYKGKR